jgi:drug/metabolite transporter (DMT)-like permease
MSKNYKAGVILLLAAVLSWASAPVFIHYFTGIFDQWTQNFFRYFVASCALWIFSARFFREDVRKALGMVRVFFLPAIMTFGFQVLWVMGLTYVEPTMASLVTKSSVILTAILAFIVHADERVSIRDPRYILGTLVALVGCCALILGGDIESRFYVKGIIVLSIASMIWAWYMVYIKKLLNMINPVVVFTMICTGATVLLFVGMLIWGRPSVFFSSSAAIKVMIVFSGVLCIAGAHAFYCMAVRTMGVAISASFTLAQPLFTGVISFFVFGEMLNAVQLASGVIILAGSYFVVNASRRR